MMALTAKYKMKNQTKTPQSHKKAFWLCHATLFIYVLKMVDNMAVCATLYTWGSHRPPTELCTGESSCRPAFFFFFQQAFHDVLLLGLLALLCGARSLLSRWC
jgi:hypothetical protein